MEEEEDEEDEDETAAGGFWLSRLLLLLLIKGKASMEINGKTFLPRPGSGPSRRLYSSFYLFFFFRSLFILHAAPALRGFQAEWKLRDGAVERREGGRGKTFRSARGAFCLVFIGA